MNGPRAPQAVIPAKAGIHAHVITHTKKLDPRLRGDNSFKAKLQRTAQVFALCLLFLPAVDLPAQVDTNTAAPLQFNDSAEERRFHALVSELRCVMCQNQSLADSNALIARDLRREVLELIRQGRSDAEVKQFLVARYGEFVLYQPRMTGKTWLLWFGPAVLLLAGVVWVARVVRKRSTRHVVATDDTQEW